MDDMKIDRISLTPDEACGAIALMVFALSVFKIFGADISRWLASKAAESTGEEMGGMSPALMASTLDEGIKRDGTRALIAIIAQSLDEHQQEKAMEMIKATIGEDFNGLL